METAPLITTTAYQVVTTFYAHGSFNSVYTVGKYAVNEILMDGISRGARAAFRRLDVAKLCDKLFRC